MRFNAHTVVLLACIGLMATPNHGFSETSPAPQKDGTADAEHQWVSEASSLVGELLNVAENTPEVPLSDSDDPETQLARVVPHWKRLSDNREKGDELLWKLWLITGLPPEMGEQDKSLRASLLRSGLTYREYVTKHARLTEEELNRLALSNATESIGSPLWYMTLEVLEKKVGCKFRETFSLHVTPYRRMIFHDLPKESYKRLSDALKRWLNANRQEMVWDSKTRQFRPTCGAYAGTDDLVKLFQEEFLQEEFFREELRRVDKKGAGPKQENSKPKNSKQESGAGPIK